MGELGEHLSSSRCAGGSASRTARQPSSRAGLGVPGTCAEARPPGATSTRRGGRSRRERAASSRAGTGARRVAPSPARRARASCQHKKRRGSARSRAWRRSSAEGERDPWPPSGAGPSDSTKGSREHQGRSRAPRLTAAERGEAQGHDADVGVDPDGGLRALEVRHHERHALALGALGELLAEEARRHAQDDGQEEERARAPVERLRAQPLGRSRSYRRRPASEDAPPREHETGQPRRQPVVPVAQARRGERRARDERATRARGALEPERAQEVQRHDPDREEIELRQVREVVGREREHDAGDARAELVPRPLARQEVRDPAREPEGREREQVVGDERSREPGHRRREDGLEEAQRLDLEPGAGREEEEIGVEELAPGVLHPVPDPPQVPQAEVEILARAEELARPQRHRPRQDERDEREEERRPRGRRPRGHALERQALTDSPRRSGRQRGGSRGRRRWAHTQRRPAEERPASRGNAS